MDKINRLLKINKIFLGLTLILSAIFIAIFFVILSFSANHPILLLLTVILVYPGIWLLVNMLFKYNKKLKNDIKIRLTRLVRQELQKEFEAANINCFFDVKPTNFTDEFCFFDVFYSDFTHVVYKEVCKVQNTINDNLPSWFDIVLLPKEDKTLHSDIVI